nr:hypothetical protein B0A51_10983 [Rachicladosporium sp. CCFEE 5018]
MPARNMRSSVFLLAVSLVGRVWAQTLAERQDTAFTVTSPKAGDTVSLVSGSSDDLSVNIAWTVSEALKSRPVFITVVQGDSIASLSDLLTINASTVNNGSYSWTANSYSSGLVAGYSSYSLSSGCNYSIALKVWTDVAYSGYFTVINPEDGGLNTTSVCPTPGTGPSGATISGSGMSSPSASSTSAGASTTASSESSTSPSTSSTTSSRSTSSSSGTSAPSRTSTNGAAGSSGSSSGASASAASNSGVSTTTLAVAVAVPIVVLLLLFGLVIWLGRRRGWFVKRSHAQNYTAANAFEDRQPYLEKPNGSSAQNDGASPMSRKPIGSAFVAETNGPAEMHGDHQPHRIDGQEVYQMPGDEGMARYNVRN